MKTIYGSNVTPIKSPAAFFETGNWRSAFQLHMDNADPTNRQVQSLKQDFTGLSQSDSKTSYDAATMKAMHYYHTNRQTDQWNKEKGPRKDSHKRGHRIYNNCAIQPCWGGGEGLSLKQTSGPEQPGGMGGELTVWPLTCAGNKNQVQMWRLVENNIRAYLYDLGGSKDIGDRTQKA